MARNDKAAAASGLVEVTMWRGTYEDAVDGVRVYRGPGSVISVSAEDAAQLKALGFVKPDDYVAPEEVQDGSVKITSEEGAQVTIGQA